MIFDVYLLVIKNQGIKVKKFIEEIRKTSEDRRRSCEGTLEKRGGADGARGSDGDSTVLQVLGRDGLPQINPICSC